MRTILSTIVASLITFSLATTATAQENDYQQLVQCSEAVSKGTVSKIISMLSGKGWSSEMQKQNITEPCEKFCQELTYQVEPNVGEKMDCSQGVHDNSVSARVGRLFSKEQLKKHLDEKRAKRINQLNK